MIKELLLKIIEQKHQELQVFNNHGIFEKIKDFEGNAIGQIGEKFIKEVFENFSIPFDKNCKEIIHDEYDLISNGNKVEIKTARKGLKNNTFQFNGINPKYNYDYIILLGITYSDVFYYIINKKQDYFYDHQLRKEYIKINKKPKQLVQMNPGNTVNLKLTLNLKDLKNGDFFVQDLKNIFGQNI